VPVPAFKSKFDAAPGLGNSADQASITSAPVAAPAESSALSMPHPTSTNLVAPVSLGCVAGTQGANSSTAAGSTATLKGRAKASPPHPFQQNSLVSPNCGPLPPHVVNLQGREFSRREGMQIDAIAHMCGTPPPGGGSQASMGPRGGTTGMTGDHDLIAPPVGMGAPPAGLCGPPGTSVCSQSAAVARMGPNPKMGGLSIGGGFVGGVPPNAPGVFGTMGLQGGQAIPSNQCGAGSQGAPNRLGSGFCLNAPCWLGASGEPGIQRDFNMSARDVDTLGDLSGFNNVAALQSMIGGRSGFHGQSGGNSVAPPPGLWEGFGVDPSNRGNPWTGSLLPAYVPCGGSARSTPARGGRGLASVGFNRSGAVPLQEQADTLNVAVAPGTNSAPNSQLQFMEIQL